MYYVLPPLPFPLLGFRSGFRLGCRANLRSGFRLRFGVLHFLCPDGCRLPQSSRLAKPPAVPESWLAFGIFGLQTWASFALEGSGCGLVILTAWGPKADVEEVKSQLRWLVPKPSPERIFKPFEPDRPNLAERAKPEPWWSLVEVHLISVRQLGFAALRTCHENNGSIPGIIWP